MDVIQGLDAFSVHLTRSNAAAARDFYSRVLGLKELSWNEEFGRGLWEIPGGATLLAHVQLPDEGGRAPGGASGVLFRTADCAASAEEARRRGARVVDEAWKAPWGVTYATVADPDGNEYVFVQR